MANIKGIELARDIYDLEDTQGRTATQAAQNTANNASDKADSNETAIKAIEAVIPSTASSSNKLATKNDIPDISPGDVVTISSQGFTLSLVKAGKVVQAHLYGAYTGEATIEIPALFTLPTGFVPKLTARGVFINNISNTPIGQMIMYTDGKVGVWGGAQQIVTNGSYTSSICYLVN